ncbi:MAG: LPS assembly lipoprotein LptE [Candidatus Aminicenantales bacterium]
MRKCVFLLLLSLLLFDCGYHLRGTGSFLPPHIRRISIPTFKNLTTRFELDVKLTRSIIDELVARGKVEVVSDSGKADAVLEGEIVSFVVNPIAFSEKDSADRYNIIITARLTLKDLVEDKVIYSNPAFIYQEEYRVPEGVDFETVETEALEKVAPRFARSVVITLLEGF